MSHAAERVELAGVVVSSPLICAVSAILLTMDAGF